MFLFFVKSSFYRSWCFGKLMAMKVNKDWHLANKMPKRPTLDQRIEWHLDHSKNCQCRPLDAKILEEIKKRGIKI